MYGDEEFEGTINLVYPTIDPNTRTFPVEVRLTNRDQKVRPGMFARVTLNFGTQEHVVVPDLAIVKRAGSGDRYVYVYKDGIPCSSTLRAETSRLIVFRYLSAEMPMNRAFGKN